MLVWRFSSCFWSYKICSI